MSSKGDLENETWLNIGNFRVFAWSLAGIETSIVIRCSDGYSCCFDLGHASRESVKCDTVFIRYGVTYLGNSLRPGYRNGYLFPEGKNIVLGETDPFLKETALGAADIRLAKPRIFLRETDMFLEVSKGYEIDKRCTQIAISPSQ